MNKKVQILIALVLLSLQLLPVPVIYAETVVEEVPSSEQTIPSKVDDPLKAVKDSLPEPMPPTPEVSEDPVEDKPTSETKPEEINESAESSEQTRPAIQPLGGGIGPQTMNLVEGVDIDAQFAQLLRTDPSVQDLGVGWSGYGKGPNQLTDDDMQLVTKLDLSEKNLYRITGINYAVNLKELNLWKNYLSQLDISLNSELKVLNCSDNGLSTLNVSSNLKLEELECSQNFGLQSLDVTNNIILKKLSCNNTSVDNLDLSMNSNLQWLSCYNARLSTLDVSENLLLEVLVCSMNSLSTLDVSMLSKLYHLDFSSNNMSGNIDISNNLKLKVFNCSSSNQTALNVDVQTELETLMCSYNSLGVLDVRNNKKLTRLYCSRIGISSLDLSENTVLTELYCSQNDIDELDMRQNTLLQVLDCNWNSNLDVLNVNTCTELITLTCNSTNLETLDVSNCEKLKTLDCSDSTGRSLTKLVTGIHEELESLLCGNNAIRELNINNWKKLKILNCYSNRITHLDVSKCEKLQTLYCGNNQIFDITSAFGLNDLTEFSAYNQNVRAPIPEVVSNQATVNILKTSAQAGLSVYYTDIIPPPTITTTGDQIQLSNVTRQDLINKEIYFQYENTQLTEGASGGNKRFDGRIRFYEVSELKSELIPDKKKVKRDGQVFWTWEITNLFGSISSEDIKAKLAALPTGVNLDPSSIKVNGSAGSMADIDGTNSLGTLDMPNETITIQFMTTVAGNVGDWKELSGRVDWNDTTGIGPYYKESKGLIQIQDDEQTYTPQDSKDMGILSAPIYLNFGIQRLSSNLETYTLDSLNYQTNTKVVTDGFYTRIKDDRGSNAGWKLSASLSKFADAANQEMPNGDSTSLSFNNLSIERVTNRDTQQENIESPPIGADVPSFYQGSETLQAGQTAKILIRANQNEGRGTWQLRIPFNDVSLNVPANSGKKGTIYKAKLTWSLDNTP